MKRKSNGAAGRRRANKTGTLEKRGGRWLARWYVNDKQGKRLRKSKILDLPDGAGIDEARKELQELTNGGALITRESEIKRLQSELDGVEAERREWEAKQPALSLADAFNAYLASGERHDTGELTLSNYACYYDGLVEWLSKNRPDYKELRDVTQDDAETFSAHLRDTTAAGTFNKRIVFFRYMWRILTWKARLTCNPWEKIAKRQDEQHSRRELTIEELRRVCASVTGEMRLLFAIGIYSGLRLHDAATLDWGKVDLIRQRITLIPHKTKRYANGKPTIIPIHPTLAAMLSETPAEKRTGYILPDTADRYLREPSLVTSRIQRVFLDAGIDTGSKKARLYMKRGFYRIQYDEIGEDGKHIVENTGLTDITKAREYFASKVGTSKRAQVDIGYHSLRHSFVSICGNAGVPLALVQSIVGHSNPKMTAHYFHEQESALQAAVAVLPDVIDTTALPAPSKPAESRLDAFRAMWRTMTDDEREQACNWIAQQGKGVA